MNANQITKVRAMLSKAGVSKQKESIVSSFTNGRTESLTAMTQSETEEIINYLNGLIGNAPDKNQPMRKKIFARAFEMRWTIDGKLDIDRVNNWCKSYGYLHKELDKYTSEELPKLVSQFDNVYKSFLKGI